MNESCISINWLSKENLLKEVEAFNLHSERFNERYFLFISSSLSASLTGRLARICSHLRPILSASDCWQKGSIADIARKRFLGASAEFRVCRLEKMQHREPSEGTAIVSAHCRVYSNQTRPIIGRKSIDLFLIKKTVLPPSVVFLLQSKDDLAFPNHLINFCWCTSSVSKLSKLADSVLGFAKIFMKW